MTADRPATHQAHSLREARLFLTATPCRACQKGPLRLQEHDEPLPTDPDIEVVLRAQCAACGQGTSWSFRIEDWNDRGVINPTSRRSCILDAAQWIMLAGVIVASAETTSDRAAKRRLLIEAAQCLDEALKFYAEDNDLPPADAFFHEGSRQRFRQSPEQFSRQRLLGLRARLPHRSPPA